MGVFMRKRVEEMERDGRQETGEKGVGSGWSYNGRMSSFFSL